MYEPTHFIRSHCKNNDPTDIYTQIWDVVFEPSSDGVGTTTKVATCGGRFLCVFDVTDGSLLMKYRHKKTEENLYTLAWTKIESHNILASGSASGELRLYHLENKVSFYDWKEFSHSPVNAIRWHHTIPEWLMVASSSSNDCHVTVWNVGAVTPPTYHTTKNTRILKIDINKTSIYTMEWVSASHWLLLGTDGGLVGWSFDKLTRDSAREMKNRPPVEFKLPGEDEPHVDSVCSLGGDLVAVKCVNSGKLYVWGIGRREDDGHKRVVEVQVLAEYTYWKTDNFYMNIGANRVSGMFGCGDDKGNIWVYKLKRSDRNHVERADKNPVVRELEQGCDPESHPKRRRRDGSMKRTSVDRPQMRKPIGRIPWPPLKDKNLDSTRPPPEAKNIIIDKVAISGNDKHIVAVTNTNMVCIWTKTSEE